MELRYNSATVRGRERKIIFQRFGLAGGKPKTLEAVVKKLGVTRERIRQIQNVALAKLHSRWRDVLENKVV